MPILASLFAQERSFSSLENPSVPLAAGGDWGLDVFGGFRSTSGVNVNRETALTYASFWRAVNLVSNDVAKLPVHIYKRSDNGKAWDQKHPAYYLLRFKPNAEMVAFQWKKTMQMHILCEGNGYSYIDRAGDGSPLELIPLQPNRTYPIRANGKLIYVTELNSGEPRKIVPENMLHIKGLSFDGLVGYSVITKARESLGLGMAMDTYGSTFFRNGAEPSIAILHPGRLSPEAIKNLRESWAKIHSGLENAHKTAILQEGMDVKQYSMSGRDAQLIEQRQFQKHEIADWFGLPPHKLGILEGQAYNSLEQENQSYLDSAIDPWLVAWEEECNDKLLTEHQKKRDTHCVEFHRKSLIRANMAERTSYYTAMLQNGCLNRDEVREEEGYNPIADGTGKTYFVPLNMGKSGGEPSDTEATPAPVAQGALIEVPDIRQPDHYSCGACAAMAVGRYFGVGPESLQEWKDALGTDVEQSTRPQRIADYLCRLGLVVTARHNMTLDDLRRCWMAGQPVICCVQDYGEEVPNEADFDYGHYLVVIGHLPGYVIVQDSSEDNVTADSGSDAAPGKGIISEQTWLDNWHDTDIDGNPYLRFGIAVGTELLPGMGPDGNDGVGDEDDPDSQAQGNPGQQIQPTSQTGAKDGQFAGPAQGLPISATPARAALVEACRRIVRRVGTHARRVAEKHPGAFLRFLDDIDSEHLPASLESLRPFFRYDTSAADNLLSTVHASLLDVSGRCTASQLAAEVASDLDSWEAFGYEDFFALLSGKRHIVKLKSGKYKLLSHDGKNLGVFDTKEEAEKHEQQVEYFKHEKNSARCGGPGSGVPGPCPEGDKDKGGKKEEKEPAKGEVGTPEQQKKLAEDIKELEKTKEGKEVVEKGAKLAEKVKGAIGKGVKAAIDAIDEGSKGGVSLIAGGLKNKDAKAVAFGVAQLTSSVFSSVHEEIFEKGLSDATHGPAIVGKTIAKIGGKVLGTAEHNMLKAVAYAWGKATGTRSMRQFRADLSTQDKELLDALCQVAADALREVFTEAGIEDVEIDEEALKQDIADKIEEK